MMLFDTRTDTAGAKVTQQAQQFCFGHGRCDPGTKKWMQRRRRRDLVRRAVRFHGSGEISINRRRLFLVVADLARRRFRLLQLLRVVQHFREIFAQRSIPPSFSLQIRQPVSKKRRNRQNGILHRFAEEHRVGGQRLRVHPAGRVVVLLMMLLYWCRAQ